MTHCLSKPNILVMDRLKRRRPTAIVATTGKANVIARLWACRLLWSKESVMFAGVTKSEQGFLLRSDQSDAASGLLNITQVSSFDRSPTLENSGWALCCQTVESREISQKTTVSSKPQPPNMGMIRRQNAYFA
jgi:hypothetical protein